MYMPLHGEDSLYPGKNSKHLKTYDCQISMDFTLRWNTEANDLWNELVGIF